MMSEYEEELHEIIKNLRYANYNLKDENESLKEQIKHIQEEFDDFKKDVEDNYRRIPCHEQYEVYDSDFI